MMHVLHMSPDLCPSLQAALNGEPEAHKAEAARLLRVDGAYLPVAAVESGSSTEDARRATTDGVSSLAWASVPPPGVFPYDTRLSRGGAFFGTRSTTTGDIVCTGSESFIVTETGFEPLFVDPAELRIPANEKRLVDWEGKRIHMALEEQIALADTVAAGIVAREGRSIELAEAALSQAGISEGNGSVIAEEARRRAAAADPACFEVPDGPLARCAGELASRGIVFPGNAALKAVIEHDLYFGEKLIWWYTEIGDGLDTAEREELLDLVALEFAGTGWPCNGDRQDATERFASAFADGLAAAGWSWENAPAPRNKGPS